MPPFKEQILRDLGQEPETFHGKQVKNDAGIYNLKVWVSQG
jgi:hypothetical protein